MKLEYTITMLYDKLLKKKATNVSINSEFLEKEKEKENWEINNQNALDEYNTKVLQTGVFSDNIRSF